MRKIEDRNGLMRNIYTIIVLLIIVFISGCSFDKPVSDLPVTPVEPGDKSIPRNPTPQSGSKDQNLIVNLKWESENAVEYEIYIGETNPPLVKYEVTNENSYTTPSLKYGLTYFWQIVSILSDGTKKAGPVWNFTTIERFHNVTDGYALIFQKLETNLPNEVRILFQVVNLYGKGVANLNLDNFEVFENEHQLSQAESELIIQRLPTVNYKIETRLFLDNSTSVETELSQIRNSARNIVSGIRKNQEFAIYQFSDSEKLIQDFSSDINILNDAIENKFVQGVRTTDFYGTVMKGNSMWKDSSNVDGILQGIMVIISDGNDTHGSRKLSEAIHSTKDKLIYTVGLGAEIQPHILNAVGTGGYFLIGSEVLIRDKFESVEDSILTFANSFYEMKYKTPKRGNVNHTIIIRIKDNPHVGESSYIQSVFNSSRFN